MPSIQNLLCVAWLVCVPGSQLASAQHKFMQGYRHRLASTLRDQPSWATPLVTVAPRVEQGFRADFVRQSTAQGQTTWNYGNTKGLQIVPLARMEIRFSPPPFYAHTGGKAEDGFGDVAFRFKYRLYGSNEEHHNAILTAVLGASIPTGKSANGSCCAILSPTIELGKGFGKLVLITSAGGSLPVSNVSKTGRQVMLNNAFQYHATRFLWLQTEFNSTLFQGGKNDGKSQTFATPGILVSRIPLRVRKGTEAPLLLSFGGGEQIALTRASTYNHSPILTVRLRF